MMRKGSSAGPWVIAIGLALLTLVVYLPVVRFQFVDIDDWNYVYQNPRIATGLKLQNILWYCTHQLSGNWHPFTAVSHMLDCQLFGLNPGFHHAENVLLHAISVVLLFLLVRRFSSKPEVTLAAAMVAAVFAVHPLHVESVAWISERKDVLSGLFFLLTVHAYFTYATDRKRRAYWLAVAFFALGLMSKPMLVTVPCVLLLLDYWPLRRSGWKALGWEKWPFFGLAILDGVLTLVAQNSAGAINDFQQASASSRVAMLINGYWFYLSKFFVPTNLALFYPQDVTTTLTLALKACAVAAITVAAIVIGRRHRAILVGWLWFIGMLVPVSGLVQVGTQAYADRFSYLAYIGFSLCLFWPLTELGCANKRALGAVIIGSTCALAAWTAAAQTQLTFWQNTTALYSRAVLSHPNNRQAFVYEGRYFEKLGSLTQAAQCYSNAAAIHPEGYIWFQLGQLYVRKNDLSAAQHCFETSLSFSPNRPEVNRALGRVYNDLNISDKALDCFERAVISNPDYVEALQDFAWLVASDPKVSATNAPQAIACAERAVKLDPKNFANLAILAGAQARAGRFADAVYTEEQAIKFAETAGDHATAARCLTHLAQFRKGKMAQDD